MGIEFMEVVGVGTLQARALRTEPDFYEWFMRVLVEDKLPGEFGWLHGVRYVNPRWRN